MKEKVKQLLEQKLKEDKELEKKFKREWLRFTDFNYTQRKDKLETEIELLRNILN